MPSVFSKIRQVYQLFKDVDLNQLAKFAAKMPRSGSSHRELPPIEGDFYHLSHQLTEEQRALQLKVRAFMEDEIRPIVNRYWLKGEFPHEIIPRLASLNICGVTYEGYGCPHLPFLMEGILAMEMARVDASIATFFGVQSGLAMGSGVAGGLTTTAKRQGDRWVLNGQKKWIGNATFADVIVIWARDLDDDQVKGFLVRKAAPGMDVEKIEDKMALRIVQNALITLRDCTVPESDRLQNANSFKDTAKVLRMTRAGVAWEAVGCARGAY